MHHNSDRCPDATTTVYSNMDRTAIVMIPPARAVARSESRVVAQRRRPHDQDRRPRTLEPGQRPRVVDVHAVVDEGPFSPAEEPPDVMVAASRKKHLPTGDHTRLQDHQLPELVHPASVVWRLHPPPPQVVQLWKT